MNLPLFRQMMKNQLKGMSNYAFGSAFYILLMFALYPGIAKNASALNELLGALPQGVVNALNIQGGFGSLEAFISGEYYGLILPILMAVFSIMLTTQLMARLVDQGSMGYLLATPTTRGRVAFTQACVYVAGLLLIAVVTTAAGFLSSAWIVGDRYVFHAARFAMMNVGVAALFFAVGGISFLVSAACDDERRALGLSGALAFGMFTLDLLGKIGEGVGWLRWFSVFALYRPSDIAAGSGSLALTAPILIAIGAAGFAIGIAVFRKRDLPL